MTVTLRIRHEDIVGRLQDATSEHYSFIYGLMKSIALGIGAFTFLPIVIEPAYRVPKLSLWTASIVAIMVSYVTTARGVVLTGWRCSVFDVVVPLAMGMVECLLFAVLEARTNAKEVWRFWPVVLSIHSLLAVALVTNRLVMTRTADFADDLAPLVENYRRWLRSDIAGASVYCAVFAIFSGWLNRRWLAEPRGELAFAVCGAIAIVAMTAVIVKAERERQSLVAALTAGSERQMADAPTVSRQSSKVNAADVSSAASSASSALRAAAAPPVVEAPD